MAGKIRISFDGKPIGRNLYIMAIELKNNSLPDLIARARKGNKKAEGALCIEASQRIAAGERLEEPLAGYVLELLMQKHVFNYKRNKADKNLGRDLLTIRFYGNWISWVFPQLRTANQL